MTNEQLETLARRLAELLPGYLLLRDPPQVPVGAPEAAIGDGATPLPTPTPYERVEPSSP
ncbi:hypothetical protein GCM10010387_04640 [Streptomyces inusitatus]|uniref:Uncharacterized protein n=1 Tax=Streptomyces inusitatus TaxID=68221 RepID=A0A918PLM8_9ACTN|nr:hypothetical protein [Streptomyces inusitatus]GGZ15386.1 hypothetical protein GCM10010387_04640 [Streptomyces inusitatus]